MNIESLAAEVEHVVTASPETSTRFLEAVSKGLVRFEERVKQARAAIAHNAITSLLTPKHVQSLKVPWLLDAMFYAFPLGTKGGMSPNDRACWDIFKVKCKEYFLPEPGRPNHDSIQWLRNVRPECLEWMCASVLELGEMP